MRTFIISLFFFAVSGQAFASSQDNVMAMTPELSLLIFGNIFFVIFILWATRIVFPNFYKRYFSIFGRVFGTFGKMVLIPDIEGPNLARQVVALKNELNELQTSLAANFKDSGARAENFELHPDLALDIVISSRIRRDTESMNLSELLQLRQDISYLGQQREAEEDLELATDHELRSARSIKKNMLNFFIVFNFLLIISSVVQNISIPNQLNATVYQSVTALYISLAVFIVYVYRAANARILIILAAKEDSKRIFNAERYLKSRSELPTSERDVEVLKLLLTNRIEKERGSEHPYELVLKGVTNSNVLLKGGKVTTSAIKKD